MTKICTKCKIEKSIEEFNYRKDTNNYRTQCKQCIKENNKLYFIKNKVKIKELNKLWRKNNPEKSKEIYSRYRKTEKRRLVANKWARKNKDKQLKYFRDKYNSDIQFNIAIKFRRRIGMAIKSQFTEKSKSTIKLLGCNYKEFVDYFKLKFTEGMTWEHFMSGKIHIDHIKPCSKFDLSKEDQQKECFNYKNLQPLWAEDNLKKGNKLLYNS